MDLIEKELERERWDNEVIKPMFKKYESVPTELKYMLIEKDYINMYGKSMANDQMRYMYDYTDNFIFSFENALASFSKTVRKNLLNKYFEELAFKDWRKILESGSYNINFSKNWKKDKEHFIKVVAEKEDKKEYVKLILDGYEN